MERLHGFEWNKRDKEHTILILTQEDIDNQVDYHGGANHELLVLPSKYNEDINIIISLKDKEYLSAAKITAKTRCGRIIYV